MTDQKDRDVETLVDEIKLKILNYYKEYEECIDKQLEEFDNAIIKLTQLNENRLKDVDETKENVIDIVEDSSPVDSKIKLIRAKFKSIYNKMNDDYSTLVEISNFDHLTKLYNRRQFDLQISSACDANKEFYLIMIDIDNFKSFNDNYGHLIGDQALKLVSSIIKKCAEKESYIPFRFGGEEFTVLCPKSSPLKSFQMSEAIRQAIAKHPFIVKHDTGHIKHSDIQITVSLGITKLIKHDDCDTCVFRADKAMYYSKKSGKNKTSSYESLAEKINKE